MTILICLAMAAISVGLSLHAGAARRMAAPTVVATVDINRVREGLSERIDAQAGLMDLSQKIDNENEARITKIEELQLAIEDEVDPARLEALNEEMNLNLVGALAWREYIRQEVDIEKSLLLQSLYRRITESVAELAELDGINLVLINDGNRIVQTVPDSQMARELQVRQQISTRRIIYSSPSIDITERLIIRMNNAYALEQGAR
jgi:Skp family chaperone for outer membrane proteins